MDITATLIVILGYVFGPMLIGWIITVPKAAIPPDLQGINVFYIGAFIFFFGIGVLLRYHLGD